MIPRFPVQCGPSKVKYVLGFLSCNSSFEKKRPVGDASAENTQTGCKLAATKLYAPRMARSDGAIESRGRKRKVRPEPSPPIPEEQLVFQRALAARLKEQRLAKGWTPKDLASRSGLTDQAIRNVEDCKRNVLAWTVYRLAKALGVPAGWLAFGG